MDSIGLAGVVAFEPSNSRRPSSAAIERRSAVQKQIQYTRRLSIQGEGGCHFTARYQGVCGSSFLWTCLRGGCSQIISIALLGYVISSLAAVRAFSMLGLLQTEDRATLGSDPSADWSPANGRSGGLHTKVARLAHCRCREKSDKSIHLFHPPNGWHSQLASNLTSALG